MNYPLIITRGLAYNVSAYSNSSDRFSGQRVLYQVTTKINLLDSVSKRNLSLRLVKHV